MNYEALRQLSADIVVSSFHDFNSDIVCILQNGEIFKARCKRWHISKQRCGFFLRASEEEIIRKCSASWLVSLLCSWNITQCRISPLKSALVFLSYMLWCGTETSPEALLKLNNTIRRYWKKWDSNKYLIIAFCCDMTKFALVYRAIKDCQLLNVSISYNKYSTKDLFMDKEVRKSQRTSQ